MLYPLNMFCCGCSLSWGVGCILFFHLLALLFFIVCTCSNIIGRTPLLFSSWSGQAQLVATGFCLIGVPIILSAAWGLYQRIEINVRIYLSYLLLSFVVDAIALIYSLLCQDICVAAGHLTNALEANFGDAFLCGAFRTASYFVVAAVLLVEMYCLWIVWSACEDAHEGKSGPELSDLIPGKDPIIMKRKMIEEGPVGGIVGLSKSKLPGPYPSPYGAITSQGSTIFGGSTHETNYPPKGSSIY
mmetsp:Transcript_79705/g.161479  ORF Transcript_79705/g.161479 Transcript_79705/m.161479 type:complete len:244 (+) Transcript_79705:155-886(+)